MKVAVKEAKNKLSKLGGLAHAGNTIVITRHGQPWFDIVPHKKKQRRTSPLPSVKPVISVKEAIEPIADKDMAGWL